MSKEMKLIMERWDKFKLQEKAEIKTVGQFKNFLKPIVQPPQEKKSGNKR